MITTTAPTANTLGTLEAPQPVRLWLAIIAGLLIVMVALGGATRLTDSGLSITEWQPILGAIPPLSAADWQIAFQKYQQIPEYRLVNHGMSMAEFQTIFWWEWGHRFFGRLIGLAFALPLAWFWWQGRITQRLGLWLAGIFVLGGLQGAAGWYMVASGLTERTDVSQYRLALHLGLAVLLFGLIVWTLLVTRPALPRAATTVTPPGPWALRLAFALPAAVFLQVILGAFVAGIDAGLSHTTWPLMDGALIPSGLFAMDPWWLNLFENALTVQFQHRMLAYLITALALATLFVSPAHGWAQAVAGAVLAQAALGVWTLLAMVPVSLGVAHQIGALLLFGVTLAHLNAVRQIDHRSGGVAAKSALT